MLIALLTTSLGMTISSNHACGRRAAVRQAAASALTFCALPALANSDAGLTSVSTQTPLPDGVGADFVALPSGIKVKDVRPGAGPQAKVGDVVSVQLSGRCLNLNGKKFISTQDPATLATGLQLSEPFVFTLGSGAVVPGLDQAVLGMAKGGAPHASDSLPSEALASRSSRVRTVSQATAEASCPPRSATMSRCPSSLSPPTFRTCVRSSRS